MERLCWRWSASLVRWRRSKVCAAPHPSCFACHLLPASRLFDSHISAGQFRAIFDGVKFLQPAIEDAWSWFAVVSGPGAEAGDDPCGEGHCSFWVRVGLAFCRIGSLVIGADGLDQGLIALIEGV